MFDDVDQEQEIGSVTIDGEEYFVNLIWSGSSDKEIYKEQMKLDAQQLGTNLVCQYSTSSGVNVFGLADPILGHKNRGYALAAIIYLTFETSFIGAWQVDHDEWVLIGANDEGLILIDKACHGQQEISSLFESNLSIFPWKNVYSPKFLNLNEEELDIRDLLKNKVKIKKITSKKKKAFLFFFFVIFFIASFIVWDISQVNNKSNIVNEDKTFKIRHQAFPGTGLPQPIYMMKSCVEKVFLYTMILSNLPGWEISRSIDCDGYLAHINLKREFGANEWLEYALRERKIKGLHQVDDIHSELDLPVPYMESKDSQKKQSLENIRDYLTSYFQVLELPIQISSIKLFSPKGIDVNDDSYRYDEKYYFIDFSIAFTNSPSVFIPLFMRIKGLVIRKISYFPNEQEWKIDAAIYSTKK